MKIIPHHLSPASSVTLQNTLQVVVSFYICSSISAGHDRITDGVLLLQTSPQGRALQDVIILKE